MYMHFLPSSNHSQESIAQIIEEDYHGPSQLMNNMYVCIQPWLYRTRSTSSRSENQKEGLRAKGNPELEITANR